VVIKPQKLIQSPSGYIIPS